MAYAIGGAVVVGGARVLSVRETLISLLLCTEREVVQNRNPPREKDIQAFATLLIALGGALTLADRAAIMEHARRLNPAGADWNAILDNAGEAVAKFFA